MNESQKLACQMIQASQNILVSCHVNPDGDSLGSMIGFAESARCEGKNVTLITHKPVDNILRFMTADQKFESADRFDELAAKADLILVVDTNSRVQLNCFSACVEKYSSKTCIIDHHITSDKLGAVNWTDTTSSAAGLMVFELIRGLNWSINSKARDALATAILTDTGWLRFSNTDARTLRVVATLVDMGCNISKLYDEIFNTLRCEKIKLTQHALASLEILYDGKLAVMHLTDEDFKQTGALLNETESIVNYALQIATVEVAIILVQAPDVIRVSLRSRNNVDVSKIANQFGGGGHARAAGCKLKCSILDAKAELVTKIVDFI